MQKITKKQRVIQKIIEGHSLDSVKQSENVTYRSITKWLVEFVQGGRSLEKIGNQRPVMRQQQLTAGHIEWVYHILLHKNPTDMGLDRFLWNGYLVQRTIQHWCTRSYPGGRVYALLKDMGFVFENPLKYKLTSEVNKQIRAAKAKKSQAFYIDFFNLKSCFKVIQGEKGGAVILRKIPTDTDFNVLFVFNIDRTAVHFLVKQGPVDTRTALDFIERFSLEFPKPATLVIPNHTIFAKSEIIEYIKSNFQQIHPFTVATQI